MAKYTFHLIPNAHLDPVWLWDSREGLNQGIATVRTVLDLMDEFEELTFIRGEAAVYQHIERFDPETFRRVKAMVRKGRWDIVGGTLIQPDTNLPATETFVRHFVLGKNYFAKNFGKEVKVAWAADSFGHSAGLPEILASCGIEGFAFSRPAPNLLPIPKAAFWWEGTGESRVMGYQIPHGWYGCERDEMPRRLDGFLEVTAKQDLENLGVFVGLGDHGGGPTRRQIKEIREWAGRHPEVKVVYSGLHRLFDALKAEVKKKGEDLLPVHKGEMNFVLRGCYSSVAKFKFPYRRAEANLTRAENTDSVISASLGTKPADLHEAWTGLLFNSFHDILPGSSIERAFDEQIESLGQISHTARLAEAAALNDLMMQVDTRVPPARGDHPQAVPMLIWNPHPRAYKGLVEIEANLDDRPVWEYCTAEKVNQVPVKITGAKGKALPFQLIDTEHSAMVNIAWRKRALIPVELPAMGWNVVTMGFESGTDYQPVKSEHGLVAHATEIGNGICSVRAVPGQNIIQISRGNVTTDLSAITVEDPWGSWGGMAEEADSLDLSTIRHHWKITDVILRERGPMRAALWVKMQAGNSRLELTISLSKDRDAVDLSARVLWNERSARLKLVMTGADEAQFEVPGGVVTRKSAGEVPGGKWVRCGQIAFISDSLYNFDLKDGTLRATVVRASRYANDVLTATDAQPWLPAVDAGELKFKFIIAPKEADVNALSEDLEQPPVVTLAAAKKGKLPRAGSLLRLQPSTLKLLALKHSEDGRSLILRVQEIAGKSCCIKMTLGKKTMMVGCIHPHQIQTYSISRGRAKEIPSYEPGGAAGGRALVIKSAGR